MSKAYYNEVDPYCVEWLKNLIVYDLIADGDVDTRSIEDVTPNDLRDYTQCHFFAGIGVWSHSLRLAGWSDDRAVWTGSCPCQPFSAAGKGGGFADERHLWPAWHHLISECRPPVVFGEQVASRDGLTWLDLVHADMEGTGYAFAPFDLCAAGVGAPHIRQRLYFSAYANIDASTVSKLELGVVQRNERQEKRRSQAPNGLTNSVACDLAVTDNERQRSTVGHAPRSLDASRSSQVSYWSDCDWLPCIDGKARPVEPGTFPLAHGAPARVGRLRAYGNAIVAPLAKEFVAAYMECVP